MTRRAVRFALFLMVTAALAVTAWTAFDARQQTEQARLTLHTVEAAARRLLVTLADVRSALQAYVAVGQDEEVWRTRVDTDLSVARQELTRLREHAIEPASLNDLDAAAAGLDGFDALNDKAARLVRNGQVRQASEMVFGDGLETLVAAATRVDSAWQTERTAFDVGVGQRQQLLAQVAGGGAILILLTVGLLLRVPRREKPGDFAPQAATQSGPSIREPIAVSPQAGPMVEAIDDRLHATTTPPVTPPARLDAAEDPQRQDRRKAIELSAMAELCTDFARLMDSEELPGLLDRAARLIDASGFVVWVADAEKATLKPALAHGYGAESLSRLPAIPRNADNATAAAWRNSGLQVVRTNGMTPGALVAPILTGGGCVGVLAAEVRHGRESSESVRALTRIVAAQLATLVAIPPPRVADAPERVEVGS